MMGTSLALVKGWEPGLQALFAGEIARHGAVEITKDSGLFEAAKE